MKKSNLAIGPDEILGMQFDSGYKRYFVFGRDPQKMFAEVVKMFNSYAGTKYNSRTFKEYCKENECYYFLYRFYINNLISFDDDCYSLGERNGTKVEYHRFA
jgi:hypothetical protein